MTSDIKEGENRSTAGQGTDATLPDSPARLYFIKGVNLPVELLPVFNLMKEGSTLCVEAHTLEMPGSGARCDMRHISDFAPEAGEASPRICGREWVAGLTGTVLKSTGKPVWQSFEYKGISAWWFLEIVFQEPAYLNLRRHQALEKAARVLGKDQVREFKPPLQAQLPLVPELHSPQLARRQLARHVSHALQLRTRLREWSALFRQWISLRRLGRRDVLCVIEHENLRRHLDQSGLHIQAVLPYAEGVIEALHERVGDRCQVLMRQRSLARFEGWEFLGPALPPLVMRGLPKGFDEALEEVYELSRSIIEGYFSLNTLREIMVSRLAEYDLYLKLLQRVQPKALFIYNWEGVFRPLTTAARASGCRVVGVQQALGPYLHALDHHEVGYFSSSSPQGFAVPDRLAVWGEEHAREIAGYGYAWDGISVTGYARLDKHAQVAADRQSVREQTCRLLNLPPDGRYLLFTGQSRVLDTIILRDEHFLETLTCLCRLAIEFDFKIIMKPWTSDDLAMVQKAVVDYPGLVFVAPQNVLVSNASLLSICDWLLGTFSSIVGEAILSGAAGVLLDYPESRYYFDLPHVEMYRSLVPFVSRPEDLESVLRPLIADESTRIATVRRAREALTPIFGACDGLAGTRIAELVLSEAGL